MSRAPLIALPGFGMSPRLLQPLGCPGLALPPSGGLPDWVARVLPQLPPRCSLLGWSLGATLAQALVLAEPGRFERLVLVSATPRFIANAGGPPGMDEATFDAFEQALRQDRGKALRRFAGLQAQGDANERPVLRQLQAGLLDPAEATDAALLAGLAVLRVADLCTDLGHIALPTLIVSGGRDLVVPPAAGEFLASALPQARLARFPAASHAPFCSDHAAFMSLIDAFLAK